MTASALARHTGQIYVPVLGSMCLSSPDADFPAVLIATPWPEGAIINDLPPRLHDDVDDHRAAC